MIDLYMLCMDLKNTQSDIRKNINDIIQDIYRLIKDPTKKTVAVTEGWKKDFRYIYGDVEANLSSNNKLKTDEVLMRYGIAPEEENCTEQMQLLFFAIQTCFSVLVKMIMKVILCDDESVSDEDVILGKFAEQWKIRNYCYPDWYCWPVFEMGEGFGKVMQSVRRIVAGYRKDILLKEFVQNNNSDYIKQMYEAVIPRELRHALGEYYTPDWLAEETLGRALSFSGPTRDQKIVDPTCGSGTFLFKAITEKRKAGQSLGDILNSVSGIDINPLAVLTAKTNYLLAIIDLIDGETEIEIPVYNADILKYGEPEETWEVQDFIAASDPEWEIRKYANRDSVRAFSGEKADVVVGNPPWVNWEYMPEEYRRSTQHLWTDYRLFTARGRELSFSKEDISVLITYVVIDKFLKMQGVLAFVIRQGVFKSVQNGVGFRRFFLKEECGLEVLQVDDLSKIRAFDNATNSVALICLRKGRETVYPVPYILWEKRNDIKKLSFTGYSKLREVKAQMTLTEQRAKPAVAEDVSSVWLTAAERDLAIMDKVLGKNKYKARTGVFTGGANAVYWLEIKNRTGEGIEVSNIVERAKRTVEKVTRVIEPDYVFPMLRGSNVKKWKVSYDTYLLCPHTRETKMYPVARDVLREEVPKTYDYLCHFKNDLDGRKGFAGWEKEIQRQEFQALLRIGEYTFSKYKMIWKYIASEFVCAVIGCVEDKYLGSKLLLPNEKIMYVSMENEEEAYYLCGILSSTLIADCVKSYMNPTSISAHVLDKLNIPDFDRNDQDHLEIARLCKEGHGKTEIGDYIAKIDTIVSRMYR